MTAECPTCAKRGYDDADYHRLHRHWCDAVAEIERLREKITTLENDSEDSRIDTIAEGAASGFAAGVRSAEYEIERLRGALELAEEALVSFNETDEILHPIRRALRQQKAPGDEPGAKLAADLNQPT